MNHRATESTEKTEQRAAPQMHTDQRQKLEFARYDLQDRLSHLEFLSGHLISEERHLNELRRSSCSGHCERCGESHDGRGWSHVSKSLDVISQARSSIDGLADDLKRLVELLEDMQKSRPSPELTAHSL